MKIKKFVLCKAVRKISETELKIEGEFKNIPIPRLPTDISAMAFFHLLLPLDDQAIHKWRVIFNEPVGTQPISPAYGTFPRGYIAEGNDFAEVIAGVDFSFSVFVEGNYSVALEVDGNILATQVFGVYTSQSVN